VLTLSVPCGTDWYMAWTPNKRAPGGPRPVPNLTLLKLRMQAGLSREDLGHMAGISGKQVGLIERGLATHSRASTHADLTAALAAALNKDVDQLEVFPISRRYRR
jgi:DNA-binding XRE family transcriptional regulator